MPTRSVKPRKTTQRRTPGARRAAKATARTSTGRMDAISLLKQDHARVKQMLNRLDATTERAGNQRRELFKQIENELKVHTRLEEEIFYPAFQEAVKKNDEHMYYEAVEEHHIVDILLGEMKGCNVESEEFSAKAKVLKDLVLHHAEEEEEPQMFVKARKALTAADLRELGAEMRTRKAQLQTGVLARVARTTGATIGKIVNGARKRAA
jgi:hypothetical protein